jgi:hypothetical protein
MKTTKSRLLHFTDFSGGTAAWLTALTIVEVSGIWVVAAGSQNKVECFQPPKLETFAIAIGEFFGYESRRRQSSGLSDPSTKFTAFESSLDV